MQFHLSSFVIVGLGFEWKLEIVFRDLEGIKTEVGRLFGTIVCSEHQHGLSNDASL